jgi:PAS domain S-box-containing protein
LASYVAESPFNMLLVDRQGWILECSRACGDQLTMPREQLLGFNIRDTMSEGTAEFMEFLASDAIAEALTYPPTAVQHPNGETHWYRTSVSPWRNDSGELGGVILITQNITAEQRALDELSQAEALLDAVFESIPLLISVQDLETGAIVRVNRAVYEQLGYSQAEISQTDWDHLGGLDRDRRWNHVREAAESGLMVSEEEQVPDREGGVRTIFVRRQVIADRQGRRHVLSAAEDITERTRADAALKAALSEAEAANRAKSVFLATMSHEIRTPLNGVLGMAQAMARDELSPLQRRRLEVVRTSGEALLAILGDLLDISKIEAGKLELEAIEFDLAEVAEEAAAGFSGLAASKGLALVTDIGRAAGTYRGDPTRLRQILSNLFSNAVKFTEAGKVSLSAVRTRAGKLELTVADTGSGIPEAALGRLFEKFVQVDSSTTRRFGGTGLGLAICRELTELMGGSIRAESELGLGARFVVTLPLERIGAARPRAAPELARVEAPASLRILAAEDNQVNQVVLKTLLEQAGLEVTLASDGAEALEAYENGAWDLVLMDVQMPVMDGLEATRAIRAFENQTGRPRAPIIALTANAMEHQKAEYLACGMDKLVAKPIQIADLFAAIEAAIDQLTAAEVLAGEA